MVIVSNMYTYIDAEQAIHVYLKAQKRRNVFNIEQIKNNATHYIHIMKEYIRDITIIVSNTFTNIGVKSRLYSLIKWAAFPGLAKKKKIVIIIIIVIIKLCSQRWNQSQFYI